MPKEITFYVFWGEKRDPSKIYANSNLRNLTHITPTSSYVYTFFTYTLKEITALQLTYFSNLFFLIANYLFFLSAFFLGPYSERNFIYFL